MSTGALTLKGYYTKRILTTTVALIGAAGGIGFLYMKINPSYNEKFSAILDDIKPYIGFSKTQPVEMEEEITVSLDDLQKEAGFAPNSKTDPFLNPLERADGNLDLLLAGVDDAGSGSGIILSGIFIGPDSRAVLVNGEVRKEGEFINGVKVTKIEDGAVVFETQDGETFRRVLNEIKGVRLLPAGYKDTRSGDEAVDADTAGAESGVLPEEGGIDEGAAGESEGDKEYEIESQ